MKKTLPLFMLAAIAACLFTSCATNAATSNEEAAAVMAMAGAQLGQDTDATPKTISAMKSGTFASKDASLTMSIEGPKGGSATFSYSLTGLSPMTFSGSIVYEDFAIEYEGSTFILNGSYNLSMTYTADIGSFSITQDSTGSLAIAKDGGPTKDFAVDTTATSTVSYSESGGVTTIILDTVVTGTINGEAINQSQRISFSA